VIYLVTFQDIRIGIIIFGLQALSFVLVYILTGGQTLYMVKDHLKRIKLHITKGNQGSGTTKLGNPINIIRQNPMIILLIPVSFSLWQNNEVTQDLVIYFLMCLLILFLSVFWIWGSGERHILFATPFIILLYCYDQPSIFMVLIPVAMACYVNFKHLIYRKPEESKIDENWDVLVKSIQNEDGKTLMILPEINIPYLFYTTGKVLYSGAHDSYAMTFNRFNFLWRLNDYEHIAKMVDHYRSDLVLIRKDYPNDPLMKYLEWQYFKVIDGISYTLWKNTDLVVPPK